MIPPMAPYLTAPSQLSSYSFAVKQPEARTDSRPGLLVDQFRKIPDGLDDRFRLIQNITVIRESQDGIHTVFSTQLDVLGHGESVEEADAAFFESMIHQFTFLGSFPKDGITDGARMKLARISEYLQSK